MTPAIEPSLDWSDLLGRLATRQDLSRADTANAMTEVLSGETEPVCLGALLMGLAVKGEADEEVLGFADAMVAAAEPLAVPPDTIDIVGTGGTRHGRQHALNVSTMAAFVAAAAGATVCKHGNVKASSTSGSFDFLPALGVDTTVTPATVQTQLRDHSLAFAWARTFHPSMGHVGPIRSALGIPTVFNILGPLVHPGGVKRILLGVATRERAEQMARVLASREMTRAWVVAGHDGLDELSTLGPNTVFEVADSDISEVTVDPASVGLDLADAGALVGGTGEVNAAIFRAILGLSPDPALVPAPEVTAAVKGIVVLNAGAALVVAGQAGDLSGGVAAAETAVTNGAVRELMETFISSASSTSPG